MIRKFISNIIKEEFGVRLKADMNLPSDILEINKIFKDAGYKLYVVGGAVRDFLMSKEPKDFDLATDAVPDRVIELLEDKYKVVETGKAFGVINVITPTDEFEIATFRNDLTGGRRPDAVEFTTINKDVLRRDLSINALFYDIDTREIVDLVGGIDDIQNNIVRTVGDPSERFNEDALRKLRAIRFAARMGAELDVATAEAIKKDNSLDGVSGERIRDEFIKGVTSSKSVVKFLQMLDEFNMMQFVFPNMVVGDFVESRNIPILLAMLLNKNSIVDLKKKLNAAKYTSDEISKIVFLVSMMSFNPDNALIMKKAFDISGVSDKELLEFGELAGLDKKMLMTLIKFQLSVQGEDLMALGFKGRELGIEMARLESENFLDIYSKS